MNSYSSYSLSIREFAVAQQKLEFYIFITYTFIEEGTSIGQSRVQ